MPFLIWMARICKEDVLEWNLLGTQEIVEEIVEVDLEEGVEMEDVEIHQGPKQTTDLLWKTSQVAHHGRIWRITSVLQGRLPTLMPTAPDLVRALLNLQPNEVLSTLWNTKMNLNWMEEDLKYLKRPEEEEEVVDLDGEEGTDPDPAPAPDPGLDPEDEDPDQDQTQEDAPSLDLTHENALNLDHLKLLEIAPGPVLGLDQGKMIVLKMEIGHHQEKKMHQDQDPVPDLDQEATKQWKLISIALNHPITHQHKFQTYKTEISKNSTFTKLKSQSPIKNSLHLSYITMKLSRGFPFHSCLTMCFIVEVCNKIVQ